MKKLDDMLKQALSPKEEPFAGMNINIVSKLKEDKPMKKMNQKKFAAIAASSALVLGIGSISVYAAWKYLNPDQVIREIDSEESALIEAFSDENAVYINETQSYGDYDVTLLGITNGENLTKYKVFTSDSSTKSIHEENEDYIPSTDGFTELNDRSYILFAVENKNQAFQNFDDFFDKVQMFPVVMGYDYEECAGLFENAATGRSLLKDGVMYYMYECNNLEKYADHDIYMCVTDDIAFSEYTYQYDNEAGQIARNEEYEGLNALFSLPFDASKANPKEAKAEYEAHLAFRKSLENKQDEPIREELQEAYDFVDQITPENIDDYATLITEEGATQTFGPADAQGRILIDSVYYRDMFRMRIAPEKLFPDGKTEVVQGSGATNNNPDTILIQHFKLNEDGTITLKYYKPNLPE